MSQPIHPDLSGIEAALKSLAPAKVAIDRDVLMFRAGQASRRQSRFWPVAAGLLAASSLTLGALLLGKPASLQLREVRLVRIDVPPTQTPGYLAGAPAPGPVSGLEQGPSEYRLLQQQILRWGLAGLTELPPAVARDESPRIKELRQPDRGELSRPGWKWVYEFFTAGEST
jgi:hypothetical protein